MAPPPRANLPLACGVLLTDAMREENDFSPEERLKDRPKDSGSFLRVVLFFLTGHYRYKLYI